MLIIAVLAGLAIPRFRNYKHKYYIATMIADLRNLASTEESYWTDIGTYTDDMVALKFSQSPGVTITMVTADGAGWSAKATYSDDTAICAIYYGAAPVLAPATVKNVIGCSP